MEKLKQKEKKKEEEKKLYSLRSPLEILKEVSPKDVLIDGDSIIIRKEDGSIETIETSRTLENLLKEISRETLEMNVYEGVKKYESEVIEIKNDIEITYVEATKKYNAIPQQRENLENIMITSKGRPITYIPTMNRTQQFYSIQQTGDNRYRGPGWSFEFDCGGISP